MFVNPLPPPFPSHPLPFCMLYPSSLAVERTKPLSIFERNGDLVCPMSKQSNTTTTILKANIIVIKVSYDGLRHAGQ